MKLESVQKQKDQSTWPWCCWDAQWIITWCPWDPSGGWDQSNSHLSVPALTHLPSLLGTYHSWTGFVHYFYINMCNTFCSFLAHTGMKITWLICSGRTPLKSACEKISRISAEMGIVATWAACLMSQVHCLFNFHRLPWWIGVLSKQINSKASTEHCAEWRCGLSCGLQ